MRTDLYKKLGVYSKYGYISFIESIVSNQFKSSIQNESDLNRLKTQLLLLSTLEVKLVEKNIVTE